MDINEKELVKETHELFDDYKDNAARQQWADHAKEDEDFRLGKQWTAEQIKELKARGQAPIVVNRIHPAVETAKALITSRKPGFKATAREDSDNKIAKVMDSLFEYIWDISDGNSKFRTIVDDYYVRSMGYGFVYQDPLADNGRGEVKITSLDPLDVYVDPNSRDKLFDDAENIIYSRLYTKEQAAKYRPLYSDFVRKASGDSFTERPVSDRADEGETSFPESPLIQDQSDEEYVRGYERYQMIFRDFYRTYDKTIDD